MLTIDASVRIASVVPSRAGPVDSLALPGRLRRQPSLTVVVLPTLVRPEVAGAVARITDDPVAGEQFADAMVGLAFIRLAPVTADVAERAAVMAAHNRLGGADALGAAVAETHGCDLVSLDKEHLARLTGVVRTLTPAAALASLPSQP